MVRVTPQFSDLDLGEIKNLEGTIGLLVSSKLDRVGKKINSLTRGQLARLLASKEYSEAQAGSAHKVNVPYGMAATALVIVKIAEKPSLTEIRNAGAKITAMSSSKLTLIQNGLRNFETLIEGAVLKNYRYDALKSDKKGGAIEISALTTKGFDHARYSDLEAVASGVHFTRDLVNAPANILTTESFAEELLQLADLGLSVKVIDEDEMAQMGMGALLGVGQGSPSPSKIVIMELKNAGDEPPLALIGKGVVFDTGGISLKPAAGMEDMTMDMGGAGVVAGVMKALALRKAKANVVGLVGLVENMPDGLAQRPGDVVTSMKGDTIEVINTDAEGRLVLADVLWYAQQTYRPHAMIDLATLTGAIIIGLGHENAGVFSNNDLFAATFLKSAQEMDEGAWQFPLGEAYDRLLKSNVADMRNTGTRAAGSITAAQFLKRFVKDDMPWIHLDIAGVAAIKEETKLAPKGATGWGVRAINHLIASRYEK